jgi:hypothetical protein
MIQFFNPTFIITLNGNVILELLLYIQYSYDSLCLINYDYELKFQINIHVFSI